ncbi:MAG: hypothetical protein Q9212_007399 [Teloschistes hypoglaucus]
MDDFTKDYFVSSDDIAQDYVVLDTKGKIAYNGEPAEEEDEDALPEGWEETQTPDGRRYYLDHNTKTTSWFLPFAFAPGRNSVTWSPALSAYIPSGCEVRGKRDFVLHRPRLTDEVPDPTKG